MQHTWNANADASLNDTQLCDQQTGLGYAFYAAVAARVTDGVRDTPPQLPVRKVNAQTKQTELNPEFFGCNQDGSFNTSGNVTQFGRAISCDGLGLTKGKYYNNFYNMMSYYFGDCAARTRARTFTAGQISRMRCVWDCYRANKCGTTGFYD